MRRGINRPQIIQEYSRFADFQYRMNEGYLVNNNQLITEDFLVEGWFDDQSWVDITQEVFDWASLGLGIPFPFLGIAIDIINGGIYFYRGKWLIGVITWIAAFPYIGDAVGVVLKPITKQVSKKLGKVGSKVFSPDETFDAVWKTMSPQQKKFLKDTIEKVSKEHGKLIKKSIAEADKYIESLIKDINTSTFLSKEKKAYMIHQLAQSLVSGSTVLGRLIGYKSLKVTSKYKKMLKINSLDEMVEYISKNFDEVISLDSIKYSTLSKQSGIKLPKRSGNSILGADNLIITPYSGKGIDIIEKEIQESILRNLDNPKVRDAILNSKTVTEYKKSLNKVQGVEDSIEELAKMVIHSGDEVYTTALTKGMSDKGLKKSIEKAYGEGAYELVLDHVSKKHNGLSNTLLNEPIEKLLENEGKDAISKQVKRELEINKAIVGQAQKVLNKNKDEIVVKTIGDIDGVMKQSTKKGLANVAPKIVSKIAKNESKVASKKVVQSLADETAEKVIKEMSEKGVKDFAEESVKKEIKSRIKREVVDTAELTVTKTFKKTSKEAANKIAKETGDKSIRKLGKSIPQASTKVVKKIVKEVVEETTEASVEKVIKNTGAEITSAGVKGLNKKVAAASIKAAKEAAEKAFKEASGKVGSKLGGKNSRTAIRAAKKAGQEAAELVAEKTAREAGIGFSGESVKKATSTATKLGKEAVEKWIKRKIGLTAASTAIRAGKAIFNNELLDFHRSELYKEVREQLPCIKSSRYIKDIKVGDKDTLQIHDKKFGLKYVFFKVTKDESSHLRLNVFSSKGKRVAVSDNIACKHSFDAENIEDMVISADQLNEHFDWEKKIKYVTIGPFIYGLDFDQYESFRKEIGFPADYMTPLSMAKREEHNKNKKKTLSPEDKQKKEKGNPEGTNNVLKGKDPKGDDQNEKPQGTKGRITFVLNDNDIVKHIKNVSSKGDGRSMQKIKDSTQKVKDKNIYYGKTSQGNGFVMITDLTQLPNKSTLNKAINDFNKKGLDVSYVDDINKSSFEKSKVIFLVDDDIKDKMVVSPNKENIKPVEVEQA